MKISPRLTLSLIAAVALVASVSGWVQYLSEQKQRTEEIDRRSRLLASSLQHGIQPLLSKDSIGAIQGLIEQFSTTEHIAGVAVYDPLLKAISLTSSLNP